MPTLHATCRVLTLVAKTLATIPPGRDRQTEFQAMLQSALMPRLRAYLGGAINPSRCCPHVRCEALKALIWLSAPSELEELMALLLAEIASHGGGGGASVRAAAPATPEGGEVAPVALSHRLLGCVCERFLAAVAQLGPVSLGLNARIVKCR